MVKDHLDVVTLPWSAFGHMLPFFQLSIALAKSGVHVSFVSTPRNIQRLPKIPPSLATLIDLIEFPLPKLQNGVLTEGAEATVDISLDKVEYFKVAYDLLQTPFKQFIAEQLPDWIIVDFCAHWAVEIAQEYNVGLVLFTVMSAASSIFLGLPPRYVFLSDQKPAWPSLESLTKPPEWVNFPSSVAWREYEAPFVHACLYTKDASGLSDAARISKVLRACNALAIRSCKEFEGEYLNLHEKMMGKPVISVGLLPRERNETSKITDGSWRKIFEWLDKQVPKSFVFVVFGSECKLSREQVYEIAYGLELSLVPFLWALRKPFWAADEGDILPSGFSNRTFDRGMVCFGWAPQMEILAHPSIGGSLFHSGWGSVIEILQFGHFLVVLPLVYDQSLNASLLVDKGLAVEVERGQDGSFDRDGIAKALRLAMVSDEGEAFRVRAREAAVIFGDENLHQQFYIGRFVEYLKHGLTKHE
uniref:Glycosyltransferase n=1 Tax=Fagus sylvatica TaxID=28930 RepID=A0A2N9GDT5_FAGSY